MLSQTTVCFPLAIHLPEDVNAASFFGGKTSLSAPIASPLTLNVPPQGT
jgi:hypothetical protein